MSEEKLLTAEELAERLRVSKQFVYNLASLKIPRSQRLPSIKLGRLRRFLFEDVLEYFQDRDFNSKLYYNKEVNNV